MTRWKVWSVGLEPKESDTLRQIFDGYSVSDILRSALDLLVAVTVVRPIHPTTSGLIFSGRVKARSLGLPVPFCDRVVIDLRGGKVYCQ